MDAAYIALIWVLAALLAAPLGIIIAIVVGVMWDAYEMRRMRLPKE